MVVSENWLLYRDSVGRILYLTLIFMLSVSGCDEAQLEDVLTDLSDPYAGMVLIPAGEVTIGAPPGEVSAKCSENDVASPQ